MDMWNKKYVLRLTILLISVLIIYFIYQHNKIDRHKRYNGKTLTELEKDLDIYHARVPALNTIIDIGPEGSSLAPALKQKLKDENIEEELKIMIHVALYNMNVDMEGHSRYIWEHFDKYQGNHAGEKPSLIFGIVFNPVARIGRNAYPRLLTYLEKEKYRKNTMLTIALIGEYDPEIEGKLLEIIEDEKNAKYEIYARYALVKIGVNEEYHSKRLIDLCGYRVPSELTALTLSFN